MIFFARPIGFCFLICLPLIGLNQSFHLDSIATLPSQIEESSGLIHVEGRLLTHNDSGGEAALYEIDTLTGLVQRYVFIQNADNQDWEDIAKDDSYLYIGDIGNNNGSRQDLRIYRVLISDYLSSDTVSADTISFSYADQVDFTPSQFSTNYDAEALIAMGDSLYIFTKNWGNFRTNIYALPNLPGQYSIHKMDSLDSQGLITGADYLSNSQEIALTGYSISNAFLIRLSQWSGTHFSQAMLNSYPLPFTGSFQLEAIVQLPGDRYILSTESRGQDPAVLYSLTFEEAMSLTTDLHSSIQVYPNPATESINIRSQIPIHSIALWNEMGQELLRTGEQTFSVREVASGTYWLIIHTREERQSLVRKIHIR